MKIWTVTENDDNGPPAPGVFTSQADAVNACRAWVASYWSAWIGEGVAMPDDWNEAYQMLCDQAGFLDSISLEEHDITTHPAVREALAALDLAQERLRMNDIDGEELPFIHDCAVAVALLTDAEPPQMDEATDAACAAEFSEEWSGSPCPDDPDNFWICDKTGARVPAMEE